MKICWIFTDPQILQDINKWVYLIRSDLEKCSITSLAHQWILCSEWVPAEWEHFSKSVHMKTNSSWKTWGLLHFQQTFLFWWTIPLKWTLIFPDNSIFYACLGIARWWWFCHILCMFFNRSPVSLISLCDWGHHVLLRLLIALRPVRVSFRCIDVCPNDSKQRRPILSASRTHTEAFVRREGLRITHLFASLTLFLSFLLSIIVFLFNFINVPDVRWIMQHNPNPKSEQY